MNLIPSLLMRILFTLSHLGASAPRLPGGEVSLWPGIRASEAFLPHSVHLHGKAGLLSKLSTI